MLTENAVKDVIRSQKEGNLVASFGPSYVGNAEVWEVWVKQEGEFQTRFVISEDKQAPLYISQFQQFCAFVNGRESLLRNLADESKRQLQEKAMEHRFRLISLLAATVTFVGSVGALIYFMFIGIAANLSYLALLGGILASGATMFFGNWTIPKIVDLQPSEVKAEQGRASEPPVRRM